MKYYLLKSYDKARDFLNNKFVDDHSLLVINYSRMKEILADSDMGLASLDYIKLRFESIYMFDISKDKIKNIIDFFVQNDLVEEFEINDDILEKIRKLQPIL